MAYSSGTTSFGSFPGVEAKSNGFSAFNVVKKRRKLAAQKRRRGDDMHPLNNAAKALHLLPNPSASGSVVAH
jgi:hypothetical protein